MTSSDPGSPIVSAADSASVPARLAFGTARRPAGFLRRLLAYLFDSWLMLVLTTILLMLSTDYLQVARKHFADPGDRAAMRKFSKYNQHARSLSQAFCLLYAASMECSAWQATIGKRLLGIGVVDGYGQRVTFHRAFQRNSLKIFSFLPLFIGYFWSLFSRQRQTWHDGWSKCYLVIKPRTGWDDCPPLDSLRLEWERLQHEALLASHEAEYGLDDDEYDDEFEDEFDDVDDEFEEGDWSSEYADDKPGPTDPDRRNSDSSFWSETARTPLYSERPPLYSERQGYSERPGRDSERPGEDSDRRRKDTDDGSWSPKRS